MKISELTNYLGASLHWPAGSSENDVAIKRVSPIDRAKDGDVTFLANPEYAKFAKDSKASALICKEFDPSCPMPQIVHRNPYWAFAKTAQAFHRPDRGPIGVAESAFIAADASIGEDVTIYPFVFVGSRAKIGDGVVLYPGVYVGDDSEVGKDSILYPNVVVYPRCRLGAKVIIHANTAIGADGFGYAIGEGEIVKVPQVGTVSVEDDVEIGASCSVDRAAMGTTIIGSGTKLDNQVQIAHNVEMGKNCMLSAYAGIAGSAKVGDWVIMGGHSGIVGHIDVASGTKVGGMTGVVKSISEDDHKEDDSFVGFPAQSAKHWRRQQVYMRRMAEYERRLKALEEKLLD